MSRRSPWDEEPSKWKDSIKHTTARVRWPCQELRSTMITPSTEIWWSRQKRTPSTRIRRQLWRGPISQNLFTNVCPHPIKDDSHAPEPNRYTQAEMTSSNCNDQITIKNNEAENHPKTTSPMKAQNTKKRLTLPQWTTMLVHEQLSGTFHIFPMFK